MKRVCVIGTGYVGLVAGACFADVGNQVICVDKDKNKIQKLKKAELPFFEPGLDTLVERGVREGRLTFTDRVAEGVQASDIIFLAVGTPSLPDGKTDLSYLKAAVEEVGRSMNGYRLIVNKSTVPVGTHLKVHEWLESTSEHRFDVASNPEFLREGTAVVDFFKPDRVVIGTENAKSFEILSELYAPFVRQGNPVLQMSPVTAELAKYACNSFLATKISFMNELALFCEKVNGDVEQIRTVMSKDERIGSHFLYAGAGYGGSCFPKDVKALIETAKELDVPLRIVKAANDANEYQKEYLANRVTRHMESLRISDPCVAVLGLSFKPNTDDLREAPALTIIDSLLRSKVKVRTYDPVAMENAKKIYGQKVEFCQTMMEAVTGAHALVLVTEWNVFKHPNWDQIKKAMKAHAVFDFRNIYSAERLRSYGFSYQGVGRAENLFASSKS